MSLPDWTAGYAWRVMGKRARAHQVRLRAAATILEKARSLGEFGQASRALGEVLRECAGIFERFVLRAAVNSDRLREESVSAALQRKAG